MTGAPTCRRRSPCCRASSRSPPARCTSAPVQSYSRRADCPTWWGPRHTAGNIKTSLMSPLPVTPTLFSKPSRIYLTLPSVKFGYVKLQYPEMVKSQRMFPVVGSVFRYLVSGMSILHSLYRRKQSIQYCVFMQNIYKVLRYVILYNTDNIKYLESNF